MNNSRRTFLIRSFATATIVAGVGVTGRLAWVDSEEFIPEMLTEDNDSWLILSPDDRLILAMLTPVILNGVVPSNLSGQQLVDYIKDYDRSLFILPEVQQKAFIELLGLLKSLIGRVVMGGIWSSWNTVNQSTIDEMLNNWRKSYFNLINVAYIGLKELSFSTWYGNPNNWQGIGYDGPPEIR